MSKKRLGKNSPAIVGPRTKTKHPWKYINIQELYDFLYKWIETKNVTLQMSKEDYLEFLDDTCDENVNSANFILLTEDECKPEWLFAGKLKVIIEIKK